MLSYISSVASNGEPPTIDLRGSPNSRIYSLDGAQKIHVCNAAMNEWSDENLRGRNPEVTMIFQVRWRVLMRKKKMD